MTEPEPAPPRLASLDGLRGVAALVVVVCHVLAASSTTLADGFSRQGVDVATGSAEWWLLRTPLHIVWAGGEAVVVFFVLSGFVLALPLARGGRFSPRGYYPRRLLRLYLPVWGALLFAAALHAALPREADPAATWWLNTHTLDMTVREAVYNATLVYRAGFWAFNSVLWSLRWEVIFSLALPLYVLVGARARGTAPMLAVAAAVLAVVALGERGSMQYLPIFMLGVLLAFNEARLPALVARRRDRVGLPLLCLLMLTSDWWAGLDERAAAPVVALGATLAVALAAVHPAWRRALERPVSQWVGRRSFSLYLVHEPVVVTVAFALGATPSPALLMVTAAPLALIAAALFYRAVEAPSHRLSRRVGNGMNSVWTVKKRTSSAR